jgi:hypothetical protein
VKMITEPASKDSISADDQIQVDAIVARGPKGALALAGAAVGLVMLMWFAFYCFVFLSRI